ncbi:hypothetical protein MYP14_06045 [Rhodococcus pyridinivorans]|uniref:hypothetical protein n=1 Tax=Rhodococcus pyridinivorans TaxID=103816 RepID=UPI001FFE668A|nr:hypothetical protein [Rhodococcus pyridinivorans]UPK64911.1 hypothetical protein MYP14_06045 [Rhodococcus pyridinivorans]
MPTGVEVIVEDGFATVTPEPAERGRVLSALLAAVDEPSQVRTDTGGRRRSYVVLEQDARKAGLLDKPKTTRKSTKKTTAPRQATTKPADTGDTATDTDSGEQAEAEAGETIDSPLPEATADGR